MGWVSSGMRMPGVAGGPSGSLGARIAGRQAHKRDSNAPRNGAAPGTRMAQGMHTDRAFGSRGATPAVAGLNSAVAALSLDNGSSSSRLQFSMPLMAADGCWEEKFGPFQSLIVEDTPKQRVATQPPAMQALPRPNSAAVIEDFPEELERLLDPEMPVVMPSSNVVRRGQLDNRKLDKLVAALGRSKVTWRRAMRLYEWLKEVSHPMDDRLCTTLIRVCAEHGQAAAALGVYAWMQTPARAGGAGLKPTVYTYTAAMRAALSANMANRALQIWEDARKARCRPDCRMAITYIEVCSRLGMVKEAMQIYHEMKNASPSSKMAATVHAYTAAIRAATEGGRWEKGLEIWGDMMAAQCRPTGHAYAAGITACAAGGNWLQAVQMFEDMCNEGVRPDVVSCTALVSALASAKEWQRAEAVVQWMLGVGLRPNVRTFTALVSALGNAKQWERAEEMLQLRQTPLGGGVQPNAYTYSALLKALGDAGEVVIADRVFSQLEHDVLNLNTSSGGDKADARAVHNAAQQFYAPAVYNGQYYQQGDKEAVRAAASGNLLPQGRERGLWPVGNGSLDDGQEVVKHMDMELKTDGLGWPIKAPSAATLGPIGRGKRASAGSHDAENAGAELSSSWTSPSELNGIDFNLDGRSNDIAADEADAAAAHAAGTVLGNGVTVGLTSRLKELSSTPAVQGEGKPQGTGSATPASSRATTMSLLRSAQQAHEKHAGVIASIANLGGEGGGGHARVMNEVVCGAVMLAYDRGGQWEAAVGMLSRAQQLGVTPNTVMYNTALSAAAKAGAVGVVEELFARVREPDAGTYAAVIAAYAAVGDAEGAEVAFENMRSAGYAPTEYAACGLIAAHGLAGDWKAAVAAGKRLQSGVPSPPPSPPPLGNRNVSGQQSLTEPTSPQQFVMPLQRSVHVCNALIAACERAGDLEGAMRVYEDLAREGVTGNEVTAKLMNSVARKGIAAVEGQQVATAALSAALAAAGTLLMRTGVF